MTARPHPPVSPARPVSSPSAGRSPNLQQRFLHLVRSAVNQRRHLMRAGKSRPVVLWRLEQWLFINDHQHLSLGTIRRFPLFDDLSFAMPYHAAGRKCLAEAQSIIQSIPHNL